MLGANELVDITSAHIDGVLFHGPAGVAFVEKLAQNGAQVKVPTTTNVGALNLLKPDQCHLSDADKKLAFRQMLAHEKMGCRPSWTCAPYQAGARPALGAQIAWGESNAVAFANSALGARTNRYGDFLDIACAVSGRAPHCGLHMTENRAAGHIFDASGLPDDLVRSDIFLPLLGAFVGATTGAEVPAIVGIDPEVSEDGLKSLFAGAAAKGSVGLCHVVGVTPEAPDLATALQNRSTPRETKVTKDMLWQMYQTLNPTNAEHIDCVALGSPHFSVAECHQLLNLASGTPFQKRLLICTGRHVTDQLKDDGTYAALSALGAEFIVDTCIAVTPILKESQGVMMTNSAKFAHYSVGTTGHQPIFASLRDCVLSAQSGRKISDESLWR